MTTCLSNPTSKPSYSDHQSGFELSTQSNTFQPVTSYDQEARTDRTIYTTPKYEPSKNANKMEFWVPIIIVALILLKIYSFHRKEKRREELHRRRLSTCPSPNPSRRPSRIPSPAQPSSRRPSRGPSPTQYNDRSRDPYNSSLPFPSPRPYGQSSAYDYNTPIMLPPPIPGSQRGGSFMTSPTPPPAAPQINLNISNNNTNENKNNN